jgi:hypothetical protein
MYLYGSRRRKMLVQNDDGSVMGANSYVTEAEFRVFHRDRGNDVAGYSSGAVERALVRATDYVDSRWRFVGERVNVDQRTAWPRLDAPDADGDFRYGIPIEVKDACCEYAFVALSQELAPAPTREESGQLVKAKTETVGPISTAVQYTTGDFTMPTFPAADRRLTNSGLVVSGRDIRRA